MGTIKILHDRSGVFSNGETYNIMDFLQGYFNVTPDKSLVDYLQRIPIPSAIDYIAKDWGLEYKFI